MIEECLKKKKNQSKSIIEELNSVTWSQFALLTDQLSFNSEVIKQLKADDLYQTKACNFLLKHNSSKLYIFNLQLFEKCIKQMTRTCAAVVKKVWQHIKPLMMINELSELLSWQCGHFFQTVYKYKQNYLFLNVLYNDTDVREKSITSFFVYRSAYFTFFDRHMSSAMAEVPQPPQNSKDNMSQRSDKASLSGSASSQASAVKPSLQKQA